jgi:hypothetical protein
VIQKPGIYPDHPEPIYHADADLAPELGRSLSSTGARTILKAPARFAWDRTHARVSEAFDIGHAAHSILLGKGAEIVPIDAPDWRSAKARQERDAARAAGNTPLLAADIDRVNAMVDAVRAHPTAGEIFHPEMKGAAEVSLYWIDEKTGVTCRGRIDWQTPIALVDLKTTVDAGESFATSAARYGYYQQAEWYARGWRALTGETLPFAVVAVEKEPPHLVGVWWLTDPDALAWAEIRNDAALARYAECEANDEWPGYPDRDLVLPGWAMRGGTA